MPVPAERGKHRRELLRDGVYVSLRDAIVDGTLAPGERLRDPELETWLGVSRTPIRDAIARLEIAGLVHTEPGRSTVVAPIDNKAVLDAQDTAAALHELAVRLAVYRMRDREFLAMQRANKRFAAALQAGDVTRALRADTEFHAVAVDAADNAMIPVLLDQVTPALRRIERVRFGSLAGRASIAQHQEIHDRCVAGDADGAALACRANWQTLSRHLDLATDATT